MPGTLGLVVLVVLLGAAVLAATTTIHPRRTAEALSLAAALAGAALCAFVLLRARDGWVVYWFSGVRPHGGVALGIDFAADPVGAGLATLAAVLVAASFAYGWQYFDALGQTLFHVLMLMFLAALIGFSLTGDLFNMFVFFELVTVPAIALTIYLNDEPGPISGGMNFAVMNTLAAFLILLGITLVYARTGALNLAQIGESLAGRPADGLVVVSFALIVAGLFVKAAIVPMHFWLADAYAVAPAPVCILFSGAMSELGIYALARVYWSSFSAALGAYQGGLREVLVALGAATAVVGALMCVQERSLKRLLAFATVAHSGMFLAGVGLLAPEGLAGAGLWVVADGLTKAALFMAAGIVLRHTGAVDEHELHGTGRDLPVTGACVAVGGLALATLPPFGTFLGKALVEGSARDLGYGWLSWVFLVASGLVGGAVLRVAGRVFLGLGRERAPAGDDGGDEAEESGGEPEDSRRRGRPPAFMLVPTVALLAGSLALGLVPALASHLERAAQLFTDRRAYAARVLHGAAPALPALHPVAATPEDYAFALGAVALAFVVALAGLYPERLASGGGVRAAAVPLRGLRALHSGHPGDYVAWLTAGVAVFGGAFALVVR